MKEFFESYESFMKDEDSFLCVFMVGLCGWFVVPVALAVSALAVLLLAPYAVYRLIDMLLTLTRLPRPKVSIMDIVKCAALIAIGGYFF